jgi:ATP-dependent Clp protease ATP-binding subunit ClpA
LDGFGRDAREALAAAQVEAAGLGHDRIGTEHILLGLLGDDDATAGALRDAGVSLSAARHKVAEAVGTRPSGRSLSAAPPTTKRAARAVEGAIRISDRRRSDAVGRGDLLLAVLNVEGTAGQVLRGLGIDMDRLRDVVEHIEHIEHIEPDPVAPEASGPDEPILRCPSCGEEIGSRLRHRLVAAQAQAGGARQAMVFSCGSCGVVLGVGPA